MEGGRGGREGRRGGRGGRGGEMIMKHMHGYEYVHSSNVIMPALKDVHLTVWFITYVIRPHYCHYTPSAMCVVASTHLASIS